MNLDRWKSLPLGTKIIISGTIGMLAIGILALLFRDSDYIRVVSIIALILWLVLVYFIGKYFIRICRNLFK